MRGGIWVLNDLRRDLAASAGMIMGACSTAWRRSCSADRDSRRYCWLEPASRSASVMIPVSKRNAVSAVVQVGMRHSIEGVAILRWSADVLMSTTCT